MPEDKPQSVVDRFYKVASDTLRAAQLGQYGPNYTADQLRTELNSAVKQLIPLFSAATFPYVMLSPEADQVAEILEQAVFKYQSWDNDGRPAIQ